MWALGRACICFEAFEHEGLVKTNWHASTIVTLAIVQSNDGCGFGSSKSSGIELGCGVSEGEVYLVLNGWVMEP